MYKKDIPKKKEEMIQQLKEQMGNVTIAANNVGIARKTHYAWLFSDEDYSEKIKEVIPIVKDFIENALMKKISEGDTACIIFANKTRNADRGYLEKRYIRKDVNVREDSAETMQEVYFGIIEENKKKKKKCEPKKN